ncbi:S1 family peptidase [Nostoc sp. WHI]|jgi:Trypsin|uniref:S1 family peptidase n=1 Tax=Nostoc sp. WHI TaxID=2650611 RepID=UPI0018C687BB|nr:S1 family peptidase [Nostoc sp. WHI]MBG1265713.1 S1 family peptidase [Nostoc sp. WHI]
MIIRHDVPDQNSLVNEDDYPGIITFFKGDGAGTLITPLWILTAAHTARNIPDNHTILIANNNYIIETIVPHPDFVGEQPGDVDDIALVKLNSPVNKIGTFDLYEGETELGQEVLLLGRGDYGNGQLGTIGTDKRLRKATNLIDEVDDHWIKFRFDAPPNCTSIEGVSGIGDSGSPALIDEQGKLLVAGVSSWQDHEDEAYGLYGAVEYYTRVSRYTAWICSVCES